jgi:Ni2+-binding GTPase involved in maturation of urease and hydrogenase
MTRLVAKLTQKGVHPKLVAVLTSWLQQRSAQIVVGGTFSDEMTLFDMVFQGTVSGPMLWNLFFEDARHAINDCFFTEVVYADDLNAYRIFPKTAQTVDIMRSLDNCQHELHKWGVANQVCFDAAKESQHVISVSEPSGDNFKLLGVPFDPELSMVDAVSEIVSAAGWKLRTLLRTRRFYTDSDLVVLYKSHLLSYLEYRTPAIYHATRAVLCRLDAVQTRFLNDIGVDEVTALTVFRLAPLCARRDMALLGIIHRTVLGKGPDQFREFFKLEDQSMALQDPRRTSKSPLMKRSILGLIAIYNLLPARIRAAESVPIFQKGLQDFIITFAAAGFPQWSEVLSPRLPLSTHPLATFPNGCPASS